MRRVLAGLIAAFGFVSLAAGPAQASCVWKWDCSAGAGNCRQVPICQSPTDIPPPRPASVAPIPMPSVKPIEMPSVAPVGTQSCQQRYLCENGTCGWKKVCQ